MTRDQIEEYISRLKSAKFLTDADALRSIRTLSYLERCRRAITTGKKARVW